MEDRSEDTGPVRLVQLEIPTYELSQELFGPGIQVQRCRLVFHHMLPTPPEALLHGVLRHGLCVTFEEAGDGGGGGRPDGPTGLLVPWSQVAYITFVHC